MDIPIYMDELDRLEDAYFGKVQAKNEREQAKLRGLYSYCYAMKVPTKPGVHVPYNLLAFLAKVAPKDCEEEYIAEKLQNSGYLKQGQTIDESLKKRVEYAFNWIKDFEEIKETAVTLVDEEKHSEKPQPATGQTLQNRVHDPLGRTPRTETGPLHTCDGQTERHKRVGTGNKEPSITRQASPT
jgi:lysyl-tRNA synthetase class I